MTSQRKHILKYLAQKIIVRFQQNHVCSWGVKPKDSHRGRPPQMTVLLPLSLSLKEKWKRSTKSLRTQQKENKGRSTVRSINKLYLDISTERTVKWLTCVKQDGVHLGKFHGNEADWAEFRGWEEMWFASTTQDENYESGLEELKISGCQHI